MKSFLGNYGKLIILTLAVIGILGFLLSSGSGSFTSMMPKAEATMGKEDSTELVDDIAARKAPVITVTPKKLTEKNTYRFLDPSFVSAVNADGTTENLTIKVKEVIQPDGSKAPDPNGEIKVRRGVYKVTYKATEVYKTAKKSSEKTTAFIVD